MKTENEIFIEAINLLNRIITQYKIFLSEDIISFAKHYIDVDEYEMAFEGFFYRPYKGKPSVRCFNQKGSSTSWN